MTSILWIPQILIFIFIKKQHRTWDWGPFLNPYMSLFLKVYSWYEVVLGHFSWDSIIKLVKQWFFWGLRLILQIWDVGFWLVFSFWMLFSLCLSLVLYVNAIGIFSYGSGSVVGGCWFYWWVSTTFHLICSDCANFIHWTLQKRTYPKHPFEALVAAYNASQLFFDNLVDTKWQKIVEKVLSCKFMGQSMFLPQF